MKGIEFDSRKVKPGYTFVAIRGLNYDGHDFISQAIKNGATGVVGEKDIKVPEGIKYIKVKDSREALGELASEFYGNPSKKLKVIGVTGTDGKTTTAHFIYWFLVNSGKKVGLVSTVSAIIGGKEVDTGLHVTNPDSISLQKFLHQMVLEGCEYAVIEVTSHGIAQQRIEGVDFDTAILTKITNEHLDYHKTFAKYRDTKLSLLQRAKNVVLNKDDQSYGYLLGKLDKSQKVIGYSREKEADVFASEIHDTEEGISFYLNINNNVDYIKLPIAGMYNVSNLLAAFAVVNHYKISLKKAIQSLQSFKLPSGRMEEIQNDLGLKIYVDFAHTPDALKEILSCLKERSKKRLISVFGCAGERDKGKRFTMSKISTSIADTSIFTAEDPRNESIFDILKQMKKGAPPAQEGKKYICIPERNEAIVQALSVAERDDCVAILGKGHEKSMSFGGFEHPWSDQEAVNNYLNSDPDISAIILAGGKGSRMKSYLPKVIKKICGRPMISYTLENLRNAGINDITVVVSFRKNMVIKQINGAVKFALQKNPKGGTADAAKAGLTQISKNSKTIVVINGDDSAFYKADTIKRILKIHEDRRRKLTFVSLMKDDPTGLGRIIRGKNGLITKIVEEKDATESEKQIKEVNDGLYVFERNWFENNINKVKKGPQGEFYLIDIVKLAIDQKDRMATYTLPNCDEWQGVNTPKQLKEANEKMKRRLGING
ncbi:MAG: UDP-N-acetylmuramoyl-L-alanyl-D-glutamate--2,6-diaminopimelate ligase [bacterium]|nr:UDP-N-acetylmuramoyl-L-alanyl-D-glutamate--2,6-diaminopimelate ligase [bacterium]